MTEISPVQLNIPKPFNPDKNNVSKDWRIWKNEFFIYIELINSNVELTERNKAYTLLNCIGTKGIEAMNEMIFENSDERENMDILLRKFDEIFDPPFDEVQERFKFFSRRKNPKESLDNYVADITAKASKCNFGDQTEKFLIDMIILNMDRDYQHLAFNLNDISLSSVIHIYNQQLVYNQKMKEVMYNEELLSSSSENIDGAVGGDYFNSVSGNQSKEKSVNNEQNVTSNKFKYSDTKSNMLKQQFRKSDNVGEKFLNELPLRKSMEVNEAKSPSKAGPLCSKCLTNHIVFTRCPAYNTTCSYCFEKGHYTTACPLKNSTEETANLSKQATYDNLIKCVWCDTRHSGKPCPHDKDCTMCNIFPHNICFNCRANPHIPDCIYKEYVIFPNIKKSPRDHSSWSTQDKKCIDGSTATAKSSEQKLKHGCSRCGCLHPPKDCLAYNKRCSSCNKLGHFEWKCKSRPTNRALENCLVCKLRRLQHLNKNRYFCQNCVKFYFIGSQDEYDDDEKEESACTIS